MLKQNLRKDENTPFFASSSCFSRIFFPELSRKELEIPSDFVRDVLKVVPDEMVLDCASGGPWPVKVLETENGVFLRDGWEEFVEDNLLQKHEFLLFTHDGTARLVVQIFEESGLERDYATASRTHEQGLGRGATSGIQNLDRGQNEECNAVIEDEVRSFVCKSKHHLFERHIKRYNVCPPFTLFVPKAFGEQHFPGAKKTVVFLKNAKGEAWKVNCTSNGRKFVFVGGWQRFARDNNLKIGNVCVFELVGTMTLRVNIF